MGRILLWILSAWAVLDGIIMYLLILGAGRCRDRAAEDVEQMEYLRRWREGKSASGGD